MPFHIAVLLPTPFKGGVVRSAVNVARMLARGGREVGDNPRVTLGYPEDMDTAQVPFEKLAAEGVSIRSYKLATIAATTLQPHYSYFVKKKKDATAGKSYVVFNDGVSNFEDAEIWLIMSDHLTGLIPPHRRYGVFFYDAVQRYYPEIWDAKDWKNSVDRVKAVQSADFVMTSTNRAKKDAIAYLGVEPSRILTVPVEIDPSEFEAFEAPVRRGRAGRTTDTTADRNVILWPTILSQHENHGRILDGLERYFARHSDVVVQVVGYGTEDLDPKRSNKELHPYLASLRKQIWRSDALSENLEFMGFVSDAQYGALLKSAQLLLHSSRFDNGSYSIIEAAWYRLPAMSTDYEAMNNVAHQFSIPLSLYDVNDPENFADVLSDSLATLDHRRAALPGREILGMFTYDKLAPSYYSLVRDFLKEVL
jgi:glycosyltransferase involved in cell wall biosynthesis